jgi:phage terminase large subunit-like protein
LREWQRLEIRKIYDNPHGTRRAIISFGRKNAKSTMAAFLLLLHLVGPEFRINSQLYSAAQSREQAGIIFNLAAKIVRMSPTLHGFIDVRDTRKELFCPKLGTLYRALSAEAKTSYGLSPVFIIHDELGQVEGDRSEMYDALETATGAQVNPLSIIISTQAPTDADLLSVLIDDALQENDEHTVVSLYTAPLDVDPFCETTIRMANPAYGDFLNAREVMGRAKDAKRMPSLEARYRNLILNQRVEANDPYVNHTLWHAMDEQPVPLEGLEVYGGLDLSAVADLTALVLIAKARDKWQVHPTFWLPGHEIAEKARRDRVPYDEWARQGYLNLAPGKSVDYDHVARHLYDCFHRYNIRKIAFDDWQFNHLKPYLLRVGFSDRFKTMSPALAELEREILNGRLAHGGHPVLAMCAHNAVVVMDDHKNRKLTKSKSRGRIDGMVALAMARGAVPSEAQQPQFQVMFYGGNDGKPGAKNH